MSSSNQSLPSQSRDSNKLKAFGFRFSELEVLFDIMKSPPTTGSSGSSDNKKVVINRTGAGVEKSLARAKSAGTLGQTTTRKDSPPRQGKNSPRERKKWPRERKKSHKKTVRKLASEAQKDEGSKIEVARSTSTNDYDVKGAMSEIYFDLQSIAAGQAIRPPYEIDPDEMDFCGEPEVTDAELHEVSVGVKSIISKFSNPSSKFTIANSFIEFALAIERNPESPQHSDVWDPDEAIARCMSPEDPAYERCSALVARHNFKLLCILAHSVTFQDTIFGDDAESWDAMFESVSENAVSIIVFAEGRSLIWWTELTDLNSVFTFILPSSLVESTFTKSKVRLHPHEWVATDRLEDTWSPTFDGKKQVHISNNIYRAKGFLKSPRSPFWPVNRPYPEDPTLVRGVSFLPCMTCDSHVAYGCSFLTSLDVWHPLVELRDYGRRGIGIRVLERIPKRAVLDEYVGEIFPADYSGDPVYGLDVNLPGYRNDEVVATISAKRYGNWTRFINHSCDASTHFRTVTQGGRHRTVVQTVRAVEIFEELTIDYGEGYWRDRDCKCGSEKCISKKKRKTAEPVVLGAVSGVSKEEGTGKGG